MRESGQWSLVAIGADSTVAMQPEAVTAGRAVSPGKRTFRPSTLALPKTIQGSKAGDSRLSPITVGRVFDKPGEIAPALSPITEVPSMAKSLLPHQQSRLFVTDSGLETELVFLDGMDLPCFAAFPLLDSEQGRSRLRRYYQGYVDLARRHGLGLVLESPTWRANPDWGARLGHDLDALERFNRLAITELVAIRNESGLEQVVISGNLGPRGDGYRADHAMSASEAADYHALQIGWLAQAGIDLVSAFTLNCVEEGLGVVQVARSAGLPVVISFTVETDGRLPSGQSLSSAIEQVDAEHAGYPSYYMINCAHPTHFEETLKAAGAWRSRIAGLRANASCRSHAELDNSTDLDIGNPLQLAAEYRELSSLLPSLRVVGGCCGTDHRHVSAICEALSPVQT